MQFRSTRRSLLDISDDLPHHSHKPIPVGPGYSEYDNLSHFYPIPNFPLSHLSASPKPSLPIDTIGGQIPIFCMSRDGLRNLKRGFWWINFQVMNNAMNFPVANVRLETGMRLLIGDGRHAEYGHLSPDCVYGKGRFRGGGKVGIGKIRYGVKVG